MAVVKGTACAEGIGDTGPLGPGSGRLPTSNRDEGSMVVV